MSHTIRTTVRLPEHLLARAKARARERNTTLTALLEEGLSVVLSRPAAPSNGCRRVPRIPRSSGGLMPSVDTTKTSDLLDGSFDALPLNKRR